MSEPPPKECDVSSILNVSNQTIDLDDGRTLAPGETANSVDLGHPHNKAILGQGLALALVKTEKEKTS